MLTVKFASEWSVWGRFVDSRDPRILLASSFAFFLGGSDIYELWSRIRRVICPDNFLWTSSLQFPDRSWEHWGFASSGYTTAKKFRHRAVCVH